MIRDSDIHYSEFARTLEGYALLDEIGGGSSSRVYSATDDRGRLYAVKIIPQAGVSVAARDRFFQEASILRTLDHAGTPRFVETGVTGARPIGLPYIVMDLIDGVPLRESVRATEHGVEETIRLVRRLCEVMQSVHESGVIHGDLKPGNILVRPDGQPVILDFGSARRLGDDPGPPSAPARPGTLRYAAPEMLTGDAKSIGVGCDVFSLGVVCFELLSHGQWPFESGGSFHEDSDAIRSHLPCRLSACRGEPAGPLDDILNHALRKNPTRRYRSMREFGDDLGRYLSTGTSKAPRTSRASELVSQLAECRRALVVLAVLCLLAVGTLSGWGLANARSERLAETREHASKLLSHGDVTSIAGRVAIGEEIEGWESHLAVEVYDRLGIEATRDGAFGEASRWHLLGLQRTAALYGDDHQFTLRAHQLVAESLLREGRADDAAAALRSVLSNYATSPRDALEYDPVTGTRLLRLYWTLGECLDQLGRPDEARSMLAQVYALQQFSQDPEHTDRIDTLNSLGRLQAAIVE
ncbi:MAG: serine/threonine-protein kinase [Phycisphaerales bacterium]